MSAGWWGENTDGTIVSSYSTGAVNGGDGGIDSVGGLVGHNGFVVRLCRAIPLALRTAVMVMSDNVGGLVGHEFQCSDCVELFHWRCERR